MLLASVALVLLVLALAALATVIFAIALLGRHLIAATLLAGIPLLLVLLAAILGVVGTECVRIRKRWLGARFRAYEHSRAVPPHSSGRSARERANVAPGHRERVLVDEYLRE